MTNKEKDLAGPGIGDYSLLAKELPKMDITGGSGMPGLFK